MEVQPKTKAESAYTPEWFEKRAFSGLKRIKDGNWDYSDSLLLYLPGTDDKYEAVQETDTPYHKLVTAPERRYLEGIAPQIVRELPDRFEYIDLGPGTEHKEQFVFDAAKDAGKGMLYRPVDISDRYLKLSSEYAAEQDLEVSPIRSSFEELPGKLGVEATPRFISLGLTYGNYNPTEVLNLLKELKGAEGSVFINSQIQERTDMDAIRNIYAEVAGSMAAEKIRLLGLDPDVDIAEVEATDDVKVWYTLRNTSPKLESLGISAGDRLLVFQSLRPSLESLEKDISALFPDYRLLDTGEPFVGAILK